MGDPRAGRASAGGFSPRLARSGREPRLRGNAAGAVSDADLSPGALERSNGKTRISAADGLPTLGANATLAEVIAGYNRLLKKLTGR